MHRTVIALLLFLLLFASIAAPAMAQTSSAGFSGLPTNHPRVFVIDDTGTETAGRLVRFDGSSLTVATSRGELAFDQRHVQSVDRRDSLKNGLIIGAGVGALYGGVGAAMSQDCAPYGEPYQPCRTSEKLQLVAVSLGVFSAIGVGIDALWHGRTRLYEAPGARRSSTIDIVPTLFGARGLALALRF